MQRANAANREESHMLQAAWEIYVTVTVTGIFWCAVHPIATCVACFSVAGLAIWKAA